MIEIVFSDSARGSLLMAQPRGGKNIVYGFELGLSVGDIAQDAMGPVRYDVLLKLCGFPSKEWQLDRKMEQAAAALPDILRWSGEGEPVRLWYSDQPDELCGLCWMLTQLDGLKEQCGPVSAVKLPRFEQRDDHTQVERNGWGEVAPEEWYSFLPHERPVPPVQRRFYAHRWRELQEENAPLRAVLNGRLVSAPEDLYDSFIRRELARMADEFREAQLVGNVIGRCQLGISDGWIAARIQAMIQNGELEIVAQPAKEGLYRRILRKIQRC